MDPQFTQNKLNFAVQYKSGAGLDNTYLPLNPLHAA